MAHTFDIRFARPSNHFGWRGDGQLTIDSLGLDVGVKRTLASLFVRRRSRRIQAADIREVYREGDALRIEFSSDTQSREVLPLWAKDRDAAAHIVELLPTPHTIEMESAAPEVRAATAVRWRPLVLLALVVVAAGAVWVFRAKRPEAPSTSPVQSPAAAPAAVVPNPVAVSPTTAAPPSTPLPKSPTDSTPDNSTPPATSIGVEPRAVQAATPAAADETPSPSQTTRKPAAAPAAATAAPDPDNFVPTALPEISLRAEEVVVPLRQGTLAYDSAREILNRFEDIASKLSAKYQEQRGLSDSGGLSPEAFANSLDSLQENWAKLNQTLEDSRYSRDPALSGFLATLAAVTNYQSRFLSAYAAAVRSKDVDATLKAFDDLQRAQDMLLRARLYVR
jgi:hypothetical protein